MELPKFLGAHLYNLVPGGNTTGITIETDAMTAIFLSVRAPSQGNAHRSCPLLIGAAMHPLRKIICSKPTLSFRPLNHGSLHRRWLLDRRCVCGVEVARVVALSTYSVPPTELLKLSHSTELPKISLLSSFREANPPRKLVS